MRDAMIRAYACAHVIFSHGLFLTLAFASAIVFALSVVNTNPKCL